LWSNEKTGRYNKKRAVPTGRKKWDHNVTRKSPERKKKVQVGDNDLTKKKSQLNRLWVKENKARSHRGKRAGI